MITIPYTAEKTLYQLFVWSGVAPCRQIIPEYSELSVLEDADLRIEEEVRTSTVPSSADIGRLENSFPEKSDDHSSTKQQYKITI